MWKFNSKSALWVLVFLQAICALFFLYDGIWDLFGPVGRNETRYSDRFEYLIAGVLILSVIFTGFQLQTMFNRQQRIEDQLMIASGAFAELLERHFDEWALTPAARQTR